jgi:HNH endonuclease/AP2 domain
MTHAELLELLHYDSETGLFTRRTTNRRHKSGTVIGAKGHKNSNGYGRIRVKGQLFYTHRLAWFYVHGDWPSKQIDHVNGNRLDNRLSNLREASHAEQQQNSGIPKNNTSGFVGVRRYKTTESFIARIKHNRKNIHLGVYSTATEAHEAYLSAKARLHTFNPVGVSRQAFK